MRGNARKRARGAFKKAARSALALFMALVLGTDNHNLAVPFDYLALIAHRLYRRSNFHNKSPFAHEKSFCCAKIFFRDIFFVVKRLNGETKFRLAVFRRYFI